MWLQGLSNAVKVKLVGVAFAVDFGHDVFVVIVTQRTAQLVVVHVWLALPLTPAPGHFIWVRHLELAVGALPGDATSIGTVRQKLQEELPQLNLT